MAVLRILEIEMTLMSYTRTTAYSTWTHQKPTLFDGHYLRNRSTLDIGVLGYIGIF